MTATAINATRTINANSEHGYAAEGRTGIRPNTAAPVTGYVVCGDGLVVSMAEYAKDPRAYAGRD